MALLRTGSTRDTLNVGWMAAALILAAFLGAALGLVWQSAGWNSSPEQETAAVDPETDD